MSPIIVTDGFSSLLTSVNSTLIFSTMAASTSLARELIVSPWRAMPKLRHSDRARLQHFSKFFESFTVVDDNSPARPENELTHLGLLLASANHARKRQAESFRRCDGNGGRSRRWYLPMTHHLGFRKLLCG